MINTKIKERICLEHRMPQILICLACERTHLFCVNCINPHSSHLKDVYSISRLHQHFSSSVSKATS